jgi:hypothetical protein
MYTVIITHQVQDFATWQASFESDEARRVAMGVKNHIIGRIPGSPEGAVAILQVEDMAGIQGAVADPGFQEMLKSAGVLAPPTVQVVESSRSKAY